MELTKPLPPIFVLGSARSGTTILARLLRTTPWGEPFETHFIPKYHRLLPRFGDLNDRRSFVRLVSAILAERPIAQRRLHVDPAALFDALTVRDYAHIVDAIGMAYARSQGQASWGDKTPDYVAHVDLLHALFPDSRMLFIARDGRDVALSLLQKSWGPANVFSCARQWRRENEPQPWRETLRRRGQLLEVRYEHLLAEPEATLATVMAFLDQQPSPAALRELTSDVRRGNSQKWKREMTAAQIAVFEREAGDTLRRLGYEAQHEPRPPGFVRVFGYLAHNRLKRWRHLFNANVVDTIRIRVFGKEPFAE